MRIRDTRSLVLCWILFWISAVAGSSPHLEPRTSNTSAPIIVPPSQNFEGNDGPWSTFTLQIGTPAQDVTVMISTAGYQTWAVVPQGCPSAEPANCAVLRGGLLNVSDSTTWVQNNVSANGTFTLGLEQNLGYSGNGLYGFDSVALGWQGSTAAVLHQQIVAGIATPEFYFGSFGLDPRPTNFSTFNDPVSSYMANLKNQNLIPSLSWGYTAGNQYRLDKVLGSLTLGGYDASRFQTNNMTFAFHDQDIRALSVDISSIVYKQDSVQTVLLTERISAFIDSTIPWIYLPLEVCRQFESAFGIEFDNDHQAYLVNDTLHQKLQDENATVTFTLQSLGQSGSVDIVLPYAAFDLIAEYPLASNQTRYFPLSRAANDTQYTLGRTFFQEAYVIADYERRNFSVSQCTWDPNAQQHILPIKALTAADHSSKSHRISGGAIAGIVVGSIAGLAILASLGFLSYKRNWRHKDGAENDGKVELDSDERFPPELVGDKYVGQEIDGKVRFGPGADGKGLLASELGGTKTGHELDSGTNIGHELDSGQTGAAEMPARETLAAELP